MSRKLTTATVFAIAVVFAAAPFVLAQTSGSGATTGQMSPTPSSQTGTMSTQDSIHATVADVNHQHNTLKLKMQGGETVEFKVPEASLSHLNKGDSVQVSIRKAEAQSGTGTATPQARPANPSGSGTKSQ